MELPDGRVRKRRRVHNTPGEAHEFTFSCFHRYPLLKSERTCRWTLEAIELARIKHGFAIWAFVLMPDHMHLLAMPLQAEHDASAFIGCLKQSVSRRAIAWLRARRHPFLAKLRSSSRGVHHFWQDGGGYDRNLFSPEAKTESIRYIHLNPVVAELCATPDAWPWSSARWYAHGEDVGVALARPQGFGARWRGW